MAFTLTFPRFTGIDPRYFQIGALSCLVVLGLFWLDFGPRWPQLLASLAACLTTQMYFMWLYNIKPIDVRSAFITALSLTLLLRADTWVLHACAGVLAMSMKFLLRINGKHVFNPANGAIAVLLLALPSATWLSPGAWGTPQWLGALVLFMGMSVVLRATRLDTSLMYLACAIGLLFGRALYLGDPLSIPLHQMQNVALLIFAFFMISDPMTTPNHPTARFIFVAAVACLAFYLQFAKQIREGIILALFFISPLTPLLDLFFKAPRYHWR